MAPVLSSHEGAKGHNREERSGPQVLAWLHSPECFLALAQACLLHFPCIRLQFGKYLLEQQRPEWRTQYLGARQGGGRTRG